MTRADRAPSTRRKAFKTALAKDLRTAMTDAERRLWSKLRSAQLGVRFRRQQPIGPYIVDFYCAAARLVVEVDGGQHNGAQKAHDARRDRWLRDEGYEVLRFWNNEVLANTDGVLTDVMLALEAAGVRSDRLPVPGDSPGNGDASDRIPLPLGEGPGEGASAGAPMPPSVLPHPPRTPPPDPLPQGEGGMAALLPQPQPQLQPQPQPAFAVRRLALTAFRSWRSVRLDVPARTIVLTGPNGAGKTNLLEALSLLAPGRGLRRARMAQLQRRGETAGAAAGAPAAGWAVSVWLDTPEGPRRAGTGRDPAWTPNGDPDAEPAANRSGGAGRRIVRIDGVAAKGQGDLSALGAVTWLTPEMDGLFSGPAGERRRFLDRLVAGFLPRHATRLAAYEKAMRERNRLLRESAPDPAWLDALEGTMAGQGIAVAAARADFTARLAAACAAQVSAFPAPDLALVPGADNAAAGDAADDAACGAASDATCNATCDATGALAAGAPSLVAEDALKAQLRASRGRDAEAGRALAGPHRVDLAVRYAAPGSTGDRTGDRTEDRIGDMPAASCSTGEQKALLIALVLAAARLQAVERGAAPLLLLDEIAAHLDRDRRAALFDEIEGLGAQAWMTGTDPGLFDALRGRAGFVAVENGALALTDCPAGSA